MQVRAIMEAACEVAAEGVRIHPEIMLPLITHVRELERLRALVDQEIAAVRSEWPRSRVKPSIGTMIEVPRAALTADLLAEHADFFSFGTNDLTQMGYALSRDDAGKFLPDYVESGILPDDPFVSIDEDGIGRLMEIGVVERAPDAAETSRSASAASTAATRRASASARSSASTTCRARPSACRSRGSRRRRRRPRSEPKPRRARR